MIKVWRLGGLWRIGGALDADVELGGMGFGRSGGLGDPPHTHTPHWVVTNPFAKPG